MPPELPGFYFDQDRNRYFPLPRKRGRGTSEIPHNGANSSQQEIGNFEVGATQAGRQTNSQRLGVLQLLRGRELLGGGLNRSSYSDLAFRRRFLESQASHPQVWEYHGTNKWADGALQQLRVSCQTVEGEREADVLVLGGSSGHFELCVTTQCNGDQAPEADSILPQRCEPSDFMVQVAHNKRPPGLWPIESSWFASGITAIKRLGEGLLEDSAHPQRNAIVTTLGAGDASGSLYVLRLEPGPEIQEWDRNYPFPFQIQSRVKTGSSIWTAEASPDGTAASLGMDAGAGLVALERNNVRWLCKSSSSVFSQQFDRTGNILICGFRNGLISTIDLRLPAPKASGLHNKADVAMNRANAGHLPNRKGINFKFKNLQQTQHACGRTGGPHANSFKSYADGFSNMQVAYTFHSGHSGNQELCENRGCFAITVSGMVQSGNIDIHAEVSCLILMHSNENYLLASAMNGVIQQWDRRMVENGGVRTFEGHYNTHTTLQLGVDPTETFLVSGGEDSVVRIWSLASGRLLHQEKALSSPASCVCWPASLRLQSQLQGGGYREEPPFESNFTWGLWLGSSDGIHYMHGAASGVL